MSQTTVLIVEDEAIVAAGIAVMVEKIGHKGVIGIQLKAAHKRSSDVISGEITASSVIAFSPCLTCYAVTLSAT